MTHTLFFARLNAKADSFGLSALAATAEEAERLIREEYESEKHRYTWEEAKNNCGKPRHFHSGNFFEVGEVEVGSVYYDHMLGLAG